jgi:hypothetical protein
MPLSLLEDRCLTGPALMNLRGFGPGDVGVFPSGMPSYLTFYTDCVCRLLKR